MNPLTSQRTTDFEVFCKDFFHHNKCWMIALALIALYSYVLDDGFHHRSFVDLDRRDVVPYPPENWRRIDIQ